MSAWQGSGAEKTGTVEALAPMGIPSFSQSLGAPQTPPGTAMSDVTGMGTCSIQHPQQHPAPRALPGGWGILPACSPPIPAAGFGAGMLLGAGLEAELTAAHCAHPAESKVTSASAQSPAEAGFPRLKCSTAACRVHTGGVPLSVCMGAPHQAYPSSQHPTEHRCGLSTRLLQGEEPRGAGTHLVWLGAPRGGQDRAQELGEEKRTEAPNFPHDCRID